MADLSSNIGNRFKNSLISRIKILLPWEICIYKGIGNSIHFVCHVASLEQPIHLLHLYPVPNPETTEAFFEKIRRKFIFISTEEYVRRLQLNKLNDKKPFATISCDDGLREFKTYLWPIMKKYSIPCTLFIVKNFVEHISLFHRFKVSLLLSILNSDCAIEKAKECLFRCKYLKISTSDIKAKILRIHKPQDFWILDEIADALRFDFKEYFNKNKPFLNSNEIIELHNDGVRIGSHGVSHCRYDFLSLKEISHDIIDGVSYVASLSGQSSVEHAFPFIAKKVSRNFLYNILNNNKILNHYFDNGGISKDISFVTNRITLENEYIKYPLRPVAYCYFIDKIKQWYFNLSYDKK
jgi:peptidoglycan/xylan/chitin deacetylase (PgdA/CDA1 family)